jgi:hypothetical protein
MKNKKKDRDKFMNREKKKKNAEKNNKRVKLLGSKTSLEVVINIINKIKKMLKKKSKD